jgi:hypothetical protein
MELSINRDMKVDLNNLHWEFSHQLELVKLYGNILTDAENMLDKSSEALDIAKEDLEYTKAKVELEIRKALETTEIKGSKKEPQTVTVKPTEGEVKATVITHSDYCAALSEYHTKKSNHIDLKHKLAKAKIAYKVICDRKNSIEKQSDLFAREYWGVPQAPKDYEAWTGKKFADDVRTFNRETANEAAIEAQKTRHKGERS